MGFACAADPCTADECCVPTVACGADFDCAADATLKTKLAATTECDADPCVVADCCKAPPPPPPAASGATAAGFSVASALLVLLGMSL
jgi:hypothetical protein